MVTAGSSGGSSRSAPRGSLPRPKPQQVLTRAGDRLIRVDFHFPGTDVVVEVLGYRWHRTKAQMANDATRLNALVLAGKAPLQFTYDQVTLDEAMVLALVRPSPRSRLSPPFVWPFPRSTTGKGHTKRVRTTRCR